MREASEPGPDQLCPRGVGGGDDGSASMLVISLIGVIVLLGMAAAFMTAGAAAHRRAQAGADLAALAGAVALQHGEDPCAAAGRIAAENDARVTACVVEDEDVVLEVDVHSPEFGGHTFVIHGKARAGPDQARLERSVLPSPP